MLELYPALLVLGVAAFCAGAVRGFSGFGDALIFLPIAGLFVDPIISIAIFALIGASGPLPMIPSAWKQVPRKIFYIITLTMLVFVPVGFWFLTIIDPKYFKLSVSLLAIILVVLMIFNIRVKFNINEKSGALLGGISGLIGGFSGVPGAILAYVFMNSQLTISQMRALITLILLAFDIALLVLAAMEGAITWPFLLAALILLPVYMGGNAFGKWLFNPDQERLYRNIALAAIFTSGVVGLPWGSLI